MLQDEVEACLLTQVLGWHVVVMMTIFSAVLSNQVLDFDSLLRMKHHDPSGFLVANAESSGVQR